MSFTNFNFGPNFGGRSARDTVVKAIPPKKADIDIVVVTDFIWTDEQNNTDPKKKTPEQALNAFKDFLNKYYKDKWEKQGHSLGIEMSNCRIDLVPTALPSATMQSVLREMFSNNPEYFGQFLNEDYGNDKLINFAKKDSKWKEDYLMIPDRDAKKWDKTHPLEQIRWTNEKHTATNKTYKKVVRALKWWKKNFANIDTLKSYPLEHFIGECSENNDDLTLEEATYKVFNRLATYSITKPYLPDRGVPEHDVFARLTEEDYQKFIKIVKDTALQATKAYLEEDKTESSKLWQKIFGNEFPIYETSSSKFTERKEPSNINTEGRFA